MAGTFAVPVVRCCLEAWESITEGECALTNLLMTIATVGALLVALAPSGSPFVRQRPSLSYCFSSGRIFEHLASDNSKKSIAKLMDIRPDSATVERDSWRTISPEEG